MIDGPYIILTCDRCQEEYYSYGTKFNERICEEAENDGWDIITEGEEIKIYCPKCCNGGAMNGD